MPFFRKLRRFSRHKKLCEEWALANSRECVEGASWTGEWGERRTEEEDDAVDAVAEARFSLKYLGSTLVETPSSEEATAEAIKTVITMAKASGKKLPRVTLAVSLRGIRMTDLTTEEDQLQVSIYRISYCSADATHDHVFAFIATNLNETMECHAFLCPKRKMAQTVTLTVAQAFNTAYEAWQLSQADPRIREAADKTRPSTENRYERNEKKKKKHPKEAVFTAGRKNGKREALNESQKNLLIDLSNEPKPTGNSWVCFEEDALQDSKGTPAMPLTAGAAQQFDNLEQNGGDNASAGASVAAPPQQQQQQQQQQEHQQQQHVLPRSSVGLKMRNAWPESRSIDLMCS